MFIVERNFAELATVSASQAATALPASNLKTLQPSVRWRATTISDTPYVEADLFGGASFLDLDYDVVGLIGYDGAPTRNMLRQAQELDGSAWTQTGTGTVQLDAGGDHPDSKTMIAWEISKTTSAASLHLEQTFTKPGKGSSGSSVPTLPLQFGIFARDNTVGFDINLRVIAYSTISTQEVRVDFDLTNGDIDASSASGSWTLDSSRRRMVLLSFHIYHRHGQ